MRSQTESGKAFEYAVANGFAVMYSVNIVPQDRFDSVHRAFLNQSQAEREKCEKAANEAVMFLIAHDKRFDEKGVTKVCLLSSMSGQHGDVRDVIVQLKNGKGIGISAKNRHKAVKHSRLSANIDFGKEWMGVPCSEVYRRDIKPVFDELERRRGELWRDLENKHARFYVPLLNAFIDELKALHTRDPKKISENLLRYLLGRHDFYKVMKENGEVSVQSYNFTGTLGWGTKTKLTGQIAQAGLKERSRTTAEVIFDNGWQLSFRIHNAESRIIPSLKFDVQIVGFPQTIRSHVIPISG